MSHDDVVGGAMPDDLDAFLHTLRAAADDTPAPLVGEALATLFREGAAPVEAPSRPGRRRSIRVAVAGAVAGLVFGGLGVAGALPGPVQDRVADVVDHVGVDLPGGTATPTTTTSTSTTSTTSPSTSTTSSTVAPLVVPPGHDGTDAPGRSGEDHGRSTDDHGRADEAPGRTTSTTVEDGGNDGRGADDRANPAATRNPDRGDDVHPANEPDVSAPDNRGGRSECAPTCSAP